MTSSRADESFATIPTNRAGLYERLDAPLFNYETYALEVQPGLTLRGPGPDEYRSGEYVCCLGAAQTYGRFVEAPFPALLQESLGMSVANLGLPGSGPQAFLDRPRLIEFINRGRLAVVQVLSARSASNRYFKSEGFSNGQRRTNREKISAINAFDEIFERFTGPEIKEIVMETQEDWMGGYHRLLDAITVPKVLFFFGDRPAEESLDFSSRGRLFGSYPQLVTKDMIRGLAARVDGYVEAISNRGMPQVVRKSDGSVAEIRVAGRTVIDNRYYPSPQMHEDAASVLLPVLEALLHE